MRPNHVEVPFFLAYLLLTVLLFPLWLGIGLLWGLSMYLMGIFDPVTALVRGGTWGFFMWLIVGNLLALSPAWRWSAELPITDRAAFLAALRRVCDKLKLIILDESSDKVVLAPKRVLVRFRLQQTQVKFTDASAVVTGQAIFVGTLKHELMRALAHAPTSEEQAGRVES